MSQCSCYHTETGEARCWGTKEMDPCSCEGDQRQCSFYPELRERAEREHIRMNRTLPQQLRTIEASYKRLAPQTRSLLHQAASEIEQLQAALEKKAGEIVRCRECEYAETYGLDLKCNKHSGSTRNKLGEKTGFIEWHTPHFFCSDGKRKDGWQDDG